MTNQSLYRTAKCPIGNGSISNYHKFSTSNTIFTMRCINLVKKNNEEMLEDGGKFFRIANLLP